MKKNRFLFNLSAKRKHNFIQNVLILSNKCISTKRIFFDRWKSLRKQSLSSVENNPPKSENNLEVKRNIYGMHMCVCECFVFSGNH